jgi:hypothetical protein
VESREADAPRRLVCEFCGLVRDQTKRYKEQGWISVGGPSDWYFGNRLFLSGSCCDESLWFINEEHMRDVEGFLVSELRNSSKYHYSMVSRLPKWIIDSKNKQEVLRNINIFKKRLRAVCK